MGLRKGEALALQRNDITIADRRIAINKTIVYNQTNVDKIFARLKLLLQKDQ